MVNKKWCLFETCQRKWFTYLGTSISLVEEQNTALVDRIQFFVDEEVEIGKQSFCHAKWNPKEEENGRKSEEHNARNNIAEKHLERQTHTEWERERSENFFPAIHAPSALQESNKQLKWGGPFPYVIRTDIFWHKNAGSLTVKLSRETLH